MKIVTTPNYAKLSRMAANLISAEVIHKPDCVLGLATGSTPVGAYNQLIEWYEKGDLDFDRVKTVNLDEYVGLSADHPQSYHYFMRQQLFRFVNIRPENTRVPDGTANDLNAECRLHDAWIEQAGGIDLQLLGIGLDGHIGFNEPADCFEKSTHIVALHESTIQANARFFTGVETVPRHAITMGMASILQARKILLIASGAQKLEVLKQATEGKITPELPASLLQLHPDVTVLYAPDSAAQY